MTFRVTVQQPLAVYRLAQKTARATSRPIERVLADVIASTSPVSEGLPPGLRGDLESLTELSDGALRKVASGELSRSKRLKYDRLLERNSSGALTAPDRAALKALRAEAGRLMLRKAHAYALLRWRGHALPALGSLPLPA